ncbi:MAG: hypothetical protein IJT76_05245 [Clostridia bacterium]|nr:hypothetical protein [Clostridia bacterium]
MYYAPRSTEINIAELAEKVMSASLLKYFPDGLLNQEQQIAKWKSVAEAVAYTNSKNDERYKKYIKRGDKQNAGRTVRAAAEAAGYTIRAYHGTTNAEQKRTWNTKTNTWDTDYKPFTVFKQQYEGQAGHFFASDPDNAGEYGSPLG